METVAHKEVVWNLTWRQHYVSRSNGLQVPRYRHTGARPLLSTERRVRSR